MKFRTGLLVGGALGYYYGAKAGRERFEQIDAVLTRIRARPAYQDARARVFGTITGAKDAAKARAGQVVDRVVPTGPEPTYEPGLEFNPDFTPTAAEIEQDLRGEAPAG